MLLSTARLSMNTSCDYIEDVRGVKDTSTVDTDESRAGVLKCNRARGEGPQSINMSKGPQSFCDATGNNRMLCTHNTGPDVAAMTMRKGKVRVRMGLVFRLGSGLRIGSV